MATVIPDTIQPDDNGSESNNPVTLTNEQRSRSRGRGRGRASGRGRRTSRGRGRTRVRGSTRRGGAARTTSGSGRTSTNTTDPTAGWRIQQSFSQNIMLEREFSTQVIAEKARLFCISAMGQLKVELLARQLPATRAGHVVLPMDELLHQCHIWMNEKIALESLDVPPVSMEDLYKYVAVLLFSHLTGLSMEKTVGILFDLGCNTPSLERLRSISSNILAYSATNRGRAQRQGYTWSAQRDQTQNLDTFERSAFRMTCKIFLAPVHTFGTLDDDLYGTRASDNQVKTISKRKADREGHSADAVADALFRVTLMVRFRRRGEKPAENVQRLIANLLEGREEQSLHGFVLTADRGYGSMNLTKRLLGYDVGTILVMPEHLLRCHPFVGRSFLNVSRYDEEENGSDEGRDDEGDEADSPDGAECDQGTNEVQGEATSGEPAINPAGETSDHTSVPPEEDNEDQALQNITYGYDSRRTFVIDDSPNHGPAVFYAVKSVKPLMARGGASFVGRSKVMAVAVREHGTKHYSNVLTFIYAVPSAISSSIETWIAVPKTSPTSHLLFSKKDNRGNILQPPPLTSFPKDVVERGILEKCVVLTIEQRCADWFVMRQFRVTGTSAGKILMLDNLVRSRIGLTEDNTPESSPLQRLKSFVGTWFNSNRSTEHMMRGTANEEAVFPALSSKLCFPLFPPSHL